MGSRSRRAVAAAATLVFLCVYIAVAVTVADWLPQTRWIRLVYYVVVGVAWGAPLLPLFAWAERDGPDQRQDRR